MSSQDLKRRSSRQFVVDLFNGAAFKYEAIAQILSYGQYRRWQNQLIRAAVSHGLHTQSTVLDIATGTASVARQLVRTSACHVIGLDQSAGMLAAARAKLNGEADSISRKITLVEATANNLPFPDAYFDALTFTYLLRYVDEPALTMQELVRVVRPGGFVGFIEFHIPHSLWKQLWKLHTRLVLPLSGCLISDGWYEVGKFLGPSIERFYTNRDITSLENMLGTVGLGNIEHRLMSLGGGLIMWGRKEDKT